MRRALDRTDELADRRVARVAARVLDAEEAQLTDAGEVRALQAVDGGRARAVQLGEQPVAQRLERLGPAMHLRNQMALRSN